MKNSTRQSGLVRLRFLIFLVFFGVIAGAVLIVGKDYYNKYLEKNPPQIELLEVPRGIGLTPVHLKLILRDTGAGLDEVVVRTKQRGNSKEILRKSLEGAASAQITIDFQGDKDNIEEGKVELEIKAFDRSLWSNQAYHELSFTVDYHKPSLEVLTTQHNARQGGSQLVIYKVSDEDLAVSGVRVGNRSFLGFPARGLDPDLKDPTLYAAVYSVPISEKVEPDSVRVFAEDRVGNGSSKSFYNRIQPRRLRPTTQTLNEDFLRLRITPLAEKNLERILLAAEESGITLTLGNSKNNDQRLIERFALVNDYLRQINQQELESLLKVTRFESFWSRSFLMPRGNPHTSFGDKVSFQYQKNTIGTLEQSAYEFGISTDQGEVLAANDGIVSFTENLGVFGRVLGIDHGLGIASVYGYLNEIQVKRGDEVKRGQVIGKVGGTGFARGNQLLFEMLVDQVPVDPVEWCDQGWFYAHVTEKIIDVKRSLGIPVYKPLG